MKTFITSNGYEIQVSDEDYDFVISYSWAAHFRKGKIDGVSGKINNKMVILSREILKHRNISIEGFQVDHKDRNPLNNQFENLRKATTQQNCRNTGISTRSTTGYKGVSFNRQRNKYLAFISLDSCRISLGSFLDPVEAAKAHDVAAKRFHGEFAVLNFPEETK